MYHWIFNTLIGAALELWLRDRYATEPLAQRYLYHWIRINTRIGLPLLLIFKIDFWVTYFCLCFKFIKTCQNVKIKVGEIFSLTLVLLSRLLLSLVISFWPGVSIVKGNHINLSNMRMQALKSHYKREKHLKPIATICNVNIIT